MKILGIETSCDETAVAILEIKDNEVKVLSNIVSSQVKLHAKYGGVVPNLAAREHVKNISRVFKLALKKSGLIQDTRYKIQDLPIDLIAVTNGPGLGPALLVGITFAKTIAWKYQKPLIGVSHLEGHIYSNWLSSITIIKNSKIKMQNYNEKLRGNLVALRNSKFKNSDKKIFPVLNLIVSGGHTELVLMKEHGKYELIGETLDDAVGEAFDKVARLLGLSYPGGPVISKISEKGNPDRYPLPSPMIRSKDYNFSYSGLKTAVLYLLRDLKLKKIDEQTKADIAASFQKAASEVLIQKTIRAAKEYGTKSIFLSGGVSANKYLRAELEKVVRDLRINYSQPELEYTGDNAAMIGMAGYINFKYKKTPTDWESLDMDANLGFRD